MSEPLERAAQAWHEAFRQRLLADDEGDIGPWSENEHQEQDIACMRAAIAALREPTVEMLDADDDFDIYWGYAADGRPGDQVDVWRVMIDEILK